MWPSALTIALALAPVALVSAIQGPLPILPSPPYQNASAAATRTDATIAAMVAAYQNLTVQPPNTAGESGGSLLGNLGTSLQARNEAQRFKIFSYLQTKLADTQNALEGVKNGATDRANAISSEAKGFLDQIGVRTASDVYMLWILFLGNAEQRYAVSKRQSDECCRQFRKRADRRLEEVETCAICRFYVCLWIS